MGLILMYIGIGASVIIGFVWMVISWFMTEKGFDFFMSKKPNDPELDDVTEEEVYTYLKKARNFFMVLFFVSLCLLIGGIVMVTQTSPRIRG